MKYSKSFFCEVIREVDEIRDGIRMVFLSKVLFPNVRHSPTRPTTACLTYEKPARAGGIFFLTKEL